MAIFKDRLEAGILLSKELSDLRGREPLIMAIPRGGVVLGECLAADLEGDLDLVLVRKIGAPGDPEFALGAVGEDGQALMNPPPAWIWVSEEYLDVETSAQVKRIAEQRRLYSPGRGPFAAAGRDVVVVDDGIATGATMLAALKFLRRQQPRLLIAAAPLAAAGALHKIKAAADQVLVLECPEPFGSVGQFYESFPQVSDEEVIASLGRTQLSRARG